MFVERVVEYSNPETKGMTPFVIRCTAFVILDLWASHNKDFKHRRRQKKSNKIGGTKKNIRAARAACTVTFL